MKLVLIGAGSMSFTQRIVADILMSDAADSWDIALVDIDPMTLDAIHKLVTKMTAASGRHVRTTAALDRRAVLPGADFVVTTIAVGGRRAWQRDIDIPRQHGIFQPVGDTAMSGGISRAMRMIPPMIAIARDVADLCPDAWFFNYSNPMTAICRAVRRETGVPVVGLCHGVPHVENHLAEILGAQPGDLQSFGIGVNHLTFLTRLYLRGADARPLLRDWLARQEPDLARDLATQTFWPNWIEDRPLRAADDPLTWELFREHGVFPCVLDRHIVEFFPERFPGGAFHGQTLGVDVFPIDSCIAEGEAKYAAMLAEAHAPGPLPDGYTTDIPGESEQLLAIMMALHQDSRAMFSVNLPNTGQAPQLPLGAVLECNAVALGGGFAPVMADPLPAALVDRLTRRLAAIELTVDAAATGSRNLMVDALLADGTVTAADQADRLAADLIAGHRAHLPHFA